MFSGIDYKSWGGSVGFSKNLKKNCFSDLAGLEVMGI
jgi:hypothetical protein